MSVYDTIRSEALALIENVALQVAAEAAEARTVLVRWGAQLLAEFIRLAEEELASGSEKKAAVLRLMGDFYDRVVAPLDLPGPDAILDPLLKEAWMRVCDYLIDALVMLLKSGVLDGMTASFRKAA